MYRVFAVLFIFVSTLTVLKETQRREHVYGLDSSSPLFHMERRHLQDSDFSLNLSDVAGEMNSTITSTLESTAMTLVSLKENGTCMIATICDPHAINESVVVQCTNLTFRVRNESNDEYFPLYLKVIDEPTRKQAPNLKLRCTLKVFDQTKKRYRINTTMAFRVSDGDEMWELVCLRRANDIPTMGSVLSEKSKMLRFPLPFYAVAFYVPFVLTFFVPTHITQDGRKQINLEGASPVSVLSVVGNYFISMESDEGVRWAEVVIVVCLRFPFLISVVRMGTVDTLMFLFSIVLCVDSVRVIRNVAYILFKGETLVERRSCLICFYNENYQRMLGCQDLSLPDRISFHLREQPSIFLLFCNHSFEHLKKLCVHFYNFPSTFHGIIWFFVSKLFPRIMVSNAWILYELFKALRNLLITSPLFTMLIALGDYHVSRNGHHSFFSLNLAIVIETVFFSFSITRVIHALTMSAFPILLLEKNLVYLICFCLSCHYFMENYSAFTKKYQNLGWILFEEYDQPTAVTNRFSPVVIIPQELFYRACEELMPIRNSVCELVFGLIISLAPVYIVFFQAEVPKDHIMSGLKTFLMSLFPKIILSFQLTLHKKIKTAETKFKVKKIIADWNIIRAQHPHRD